MNRSLNVKFLAVLLGALVVIGPSLHFLHAFQVKRNARSLLRHAEKAKEDNQLEQAADYLKRFLGFQPGDNDALADYGKVLAELSRQKRSPRKALDAFLALDQLLRREPDRKEDRREFVRVAMSLARYQIALDSLRLLQKGDPKNGEWDQLIAQCLQGEKDYKLAARSFQQAIDKGWNEIENAGQLARLLRRHLKKPDEADRVFDGVVKKYGSTSYKVFLARAAYHRDFSKPGEPEWQKAEADVARAEKLAPNEREVLLTATEMALATRQADKARAYLTRVLEGEESKTADQAKMKDPRPYRMLAELEFQAGHSAEALKHLRDGIKKYPGNGELRWALINILIKQNQLTEAENEIAAIPHGSMPSPWIQFLNARLLVSREEWAKAAETLEGLLKSLDDYPDVLKEACAQLGRCQERLGDADRMLAAFTKELNVDPTSAEAAIGRATALMSLGKTDDAIDTFRRIVPRPPAIAKILAQLVIRQKLAQPPERRDWQEVNDLLDEAAKDKTNELEVALLRAEVLGLRGEIEQARALLRATRDKNPDKAEPWIALAELEERREKFGEALRVLDEAQKALGDRVELRLARVGYWVRRGGEQSRVALAKLEEGADQFQPEERQRLQRGLALAYTQLGERVEATRLWKGLAQEQRDALGVRLFLFDLALQGGNEAEIDQAIKDIRALEGEGGSYWRYATASYYLWKVERRENKKLSPKDKEMLAEARAYLVQVGGRRKGWSRVPLCEARIDDLMGNSDRALDGYLKAIDLGERGPEVINRTLQLLVARHRYQEAERILKRLPEEALEQGLVTREAAVVLWQQKNNALAYKAAEAAVPASSTDYRDHLWRGQIFKVLQKPREAEASLRRAIKLADTEPSPRVALIQLLAGAGRLQEAEEELKKFQAKVPADKARLAFAQCQEALGRNKEAQDLYAQALKVQPNDPAALRLLANLLLRTGQTPQAEEVLTRLGDLEGRAYEDAVWAKRVLVLVLANSDDPDRSRRAIDVLNQLQRGRRVEIGARESPEDQRLRAVVLALRKGRGDRIEAIRLLEDLASRQTPTPEERLLLAQLYEGVGQQDKAREALKRIVADRADSPRFLTHYALALLRWGDAEPVPAVLDALKKLDPDSLATLEVEARLLKAQGKDAEVVKVVTGSKFARKGPDDRRPALATLLDELDQVKEAEAFYRTVVEEKKEKQPDVALVLADFLGRRQRTQEALDLCFEVAPKCRAEEVAGVLVGILYAGKPTKEDGDRVQNWIEAALRATGGQDVGLQMQLAALHNVREDYARAEAVYRSILERNPKNVLALNNLAWLLAMQKGKEAEALKVIDHAISLAGELPSMLDTRGVIYVKLNDAVKAVKDLKEAAQETPTASVYFHLAQAHLANRDRRQAADALKKAKQLKLETVSLHPLEVKDYQYVVRELGNL
jgi:tetratricopeptide (TPR) repeat protein